MSDDAETKIRHAFVAGFLASSEGFNGERVPSYSRYDTPSEAAVGKYQEWMGNE